MRTYFLVLLALLLLPAAADTLTVGSYQVELTTEPSPPVVGDNQLRLKVVPPPQSVKVTYDMVGMSMQMDPPQLQPGGPGVWQGNLLLSMPGLWKLTVEIEGQTGEVMLKTGEGRAPPRQAEDGVYQVKVDAPETVGDTPTTIEVKTNGKPVGGATVYVGADMPGMAMGLRPVKANEVEPGRYQAAVPLSMEGLWKLTVEVDGPEGQSSQQVSVVVKRGGGFPWQWVVLLATVVALIAWRPPLWQGVLVGSLVLVAVLTGEYLERYRPADKSMGMQMDMAAPDMGMNISEMQAPVPVVIEEVERDTVDMTVNYTGTVRPYLEETIYPRVEGWLLELPFYPGDQVKKGQVVGRLDDRELSLKAQKAEASAAVSQAQARAATAGAAGSRSAVEVARAELEASQKRAERAQAEIHRTEVDLDYWQGVLRREKELLDAEAVSREEYEEKESRFATAKVMHHHARVDLERAQAEVKAQQAGLEQARSQAEAASLGAAAAAAQERQARLEAAERETVADYTVLRAGIDGVVTERITDPGGLVRPGTGILKVADLDQVRLQFSVAEEDLPYLREGTRVTVTSQALRDEIETEVTSMFRAVDARSRTGLVEALVKNPGGRLLPGSYVVGVFALRRERHVPTIPRGALASYYGEPSVWVAVERAGQLVSQRRPIRVGAESEEQLEVLDGLEPGDEVIVAGHQGLVEGQPLVRAERGEGIYRNLLLPEAPR